MKLKEKGFRLEDDGDELAGDIIYICAKCRQLWHDMTHDHWGREHEDSHGYGPVPVCTNLIPDQTAPRLSDGSFPLQVCRGQLVPRAQ